VTEPSGHQIANLVKSIRSCLRLMASSKTATFSFLRQLAQRRSFRLQTPTQLISSGSCFHGKRILANLQGGGSAVEVLHRALFLGEPQEFLADRFDERG
jgi:hypothetical protein